MLPEVIEYICTFCTMYIFQYKQIAISICKDTICNVALITDMERTKPSDGRVRVVLPDVPLNFDDQRRSQVA